MGKAGKKSPPSADDSKGNTVIENDVWIGYKATIMPGVRSGNGAVIAAHAVVTRNVEPYTIVGGNPAEPIRKRFSDEVISILQKLCWWDWNIEKITENLEILSSNNLASLKQLQ